jgi:exodeoxyribonuclease-5
VLFGDPAQLAPVGGTGGMIFDELPEAAKLMLHRVHRQAADSPILDLAHALGDPEIGFGAFEDMVRQAARRDPRVAIGERVDAGAMARAPVLVWRNDAGAADPRLSSAHARRHALLPGEPLVCDGIELPLKHRKRMDLERRGADQAQAIYLGSGAPGFARLYVVGAEDPRLGVASIIQIEAPGQEQPMIVSAASMGAVFLHGAAVTIHKAQDPSGAVRSSRPTSGRQRCRLARPAPLWKRAWPTWRSPARRSGWSGVTLPCAGQPARSARDQDLARARRWRSRRAW